MYPKKLQKAISKNQKISQARLKNISLLQKNLYALLDLTGGNKTRLAKLKSVLNIHFRNLRQGIYYDEQGSIKTLKTLVEKEKT